MWRSAVTAIPLLALAALPGAQAVEALARPIITEGPAVVPAGTQPPDAVETSWGSGLLTPLRDFGIESWWDVPRFGRWSGSASLNLDAQGQQLNSPGSPKQISFNQLAGTSLTLRNDGFALIDPRLFSANIAAGFTLQQQRQSGDLYSSSQHGVLQSYSFEGGFLRESPYNLNLFAVRSQSSYVLPSGTTTESDNQFEGFSLRLRETSILRDKELLPYFSANLLGQQQHTRQTTFTGPQVFRQDSENKQLAFDFHNGGLNSDLNLFYQLNQLTNNVYAPGSYDSQTANMMYSQDFGPNLNRRWDSRFNWYSRTGQDSISNFSSLDISQFLTIDHNVERSSSYSYQFTRQVTPYGTSTSQIGFAQFQQQIYSNLSVNAGANGTYNALPAGEIKSAGGSAGLNYNRAVPWQGRLSFNANLGENFTMSKVPGGLVPVTDAPYAVPQTVGAGSGILLPDRNIVTSSIVVVVGTGRIEAELNTDYTVQVIGDQTRIFPLPSSLKMLPGEPLNISYVYEVPSDSSYRTSSRAFTVGIDWPWIGFNFSHDESDQSPLKGGTDNLLLSQRRDAGTLWMAGDWDEVRARVTFRLLNSSSSQLSFVEARSDQNLVYQPYVNLQFNLSANQFRTDYKSANQITTGSALRLDLTWTWRGNWRTSAYAGARSYSGTDQPSERVDDAGFRLRRTWALLDLDMFGGLQRRTRGGISVFNQFVHFAAVRRF